MNRADLQEISRVRVAEASLLLQHGHHQGAYYLVGYAVECALKACVARQVDRYDFPNKDLANAVFTHDLAALVKLAGLATEFERDRRSNPHLELNWSIVKDWKETSRYELGISQIQAQDMLSARTQRRHGILSWIRRRW